MPHFADRLLDAIDATHSYLAVGLDPDLASLPPELLGEPASLEQAAEAAERFCCAIVDGVAGIVPAVKPQSAFFEQFGAAGLAALERLIAYCHEAGLLVIEDAKRGDIGTTMGAYATAPARPPVAGAVPSVPVHDADAVTLSPYLGPDSLGPDGADGRPPAQGPLRAGQDEQPRLGRASSCCRVPTAGDSSSTSPRWSIGSAPPTWESGASPASAQSAD